MTAKSNFLPRPVILPTHTADFETLLGNAPFVAIRNQIIFRNQEGKTMVTQIDNNEQTYTASDYEKLPEGAPYQLINGKLIYMPSPFTIHQRIVLKLAMILSRFVEENQIGEIFVSPLDVHFDKENIYQPDLLFISDSRKRIIKKHIYGAPDLVVEILSEGTEETDKGEKREIYGKYNVREYWTIDPENKKVEIYHNEEGKMVLRETLIEKGTIHSKAVSGFSFPVEELF